MATVETVLRLLVVMYALVVALFTLAKAVHFPDRPSDRVRVKKNATKWVALSVLHWFLMWAIITHQI
jgi:hypothetical protein